MNIKPIFFTVLLFGASQAFAQDTQKTRKFSHADTLRGSITPERAWWNLLHYDLQVTPNLDSKTITGQVDMLFEVLQKGKKLQIDLQEPLVLDSVLWNNQSLSFERDGNAFLIAFKKEFKKGTKQMITMHYHGKPREARNPPWDGGVTWTKDAAGNAFVSTSCQGLGASVWWPCKDHQYDEPEQGVTVSITTPDTLMDVSNGRLEGVKTNEAAHTKTWKWVVKNPINNYSLSMNIGKYEHFSDTLQGEAGVLDLNFYPLSCHVSEAKTQFQQAKPMIHCFEYWLGKYPFYEDGYKLLEVPYLGMEHQSAVTYGNKFKNGYLGRDLSGTGWGLKWDFIIIHESGHEWFGNNITTKDIADMWVHEGFTNYTETLFTQWISGRQAAYEYNYGIRKNISNREPIIGVYHVQNQGGNDMYYKGSNMIQTIRNSMNNDEQFRMMLRQLNKEFYHQTVTTLDIQSVMEKFAGYPLKPVFDQYLRNTEIPVLELQYSKDQKQVNYRWANCLSSFNLPIFLKTDKADLKLEPISGTWKTLNLMEEQKAFLNPAAIEFRYYIKVRELPSN